MKKAIYLLIITLLLTSCSFLYPFLNPYKTYQDDFESKLNSNNLASSSTLSSLFNHKNTTWDELVFFGPYNYDSEAVKSELGLTIPYLNDSVNDGDWVLVFVDKIEDTYSLKYFLYGTGYEVGLSIWGSSTHFLNDDFYEVEVGQNNFRKINLKHN